MLVQMLNDLIIVIATTDEKLEKVGKTEKSSAFPIKCINLLTKTQTIMVYIYAIKQIYICLTNRRYFDKWQLCCIE